MVTNAGTLSLSRARAVWLDRQGLLTPVRGPLHEVVGATGWVRTLGGVEAYLALRARVPGLSRKAVDEAVAKGALRVVPAARGCMYLLPQKDVALALRV